jgi:hypothetical protein
MKNKIGPKKGRTKSTNKIFKETVAANSEDGVMNTYIE